MNNIIPITDEIYQDMLAAYHPIRAALFSAYKLVILAGLEKKKAQRTMMYWRRYERRVKRKP